MHAYSGNVPYKENMRVESLNVDSSSIKIEVSRNGRTHRRLKLVFIDFIDVQVYYYLVGLVCINPIFSHGFDVLRQFRICLNH